MAHGIIVFGASGSGTTTIAGELARVMNFTHFDADNYYWQKTEPPYTVKREREERIALLKADIAKCGSFVVSGSMRGWSDSFEPMFDLAVFVETPTEVRMERLKKRELEQIGERILPGGDMYDNHHAFMEWAAQYDNGGLDMRSRAMHEEWIKTLPCPVIRVDGTADCNTIVASITEQFYTKPGEPWRVSTALIGELNPLRFVVIFARMNGKWIYARHKKRDTWETAGGHIEPGETPYEAAKRELYEETGAIDFDIAGVFDYAVHTATEFSYGRVFFAEVRKLGKLPESEMAEVRLFDSIPDPMTYLQILPVLYHKIQTHLMIQSSPDDESVEWGGRQHFVYREKQSENRTNRT